MSGKLHFLYCTGTAYTLSMFGNALKQSVATGTWFWGDPSVNPELNKQTYYVEGLNGKQYSWDGEVFNDPFPYMLNPNIWDISRVAYADATITILSGSSLIGGMGDSINDGVTKVIERINALPLGTPFAIGGYSQGAAVMAQVYNELRYGSLTSRYPSFLGGVCFGSPRRQVNFRGEIGGTWSGAWDIPGSTTGGHGSFPDTGPWARLSNCDGTEWIEFAAPDDIFTCTGDSNVGINWTNGNDALLGLLSSEYAGPILLQAAIGAIFPIVSPIIDAIETAFALGGKLNYLIDAAGQIGTMPGAGHVIYPSLPPPNADGTFSVITEEVTTTYTSAGAEANVATIRRPQGRLAPRPDPEPVSITHTYLKADGPTCYQLALSWLEAKAQQFAVAPIILPSTGSVGWSTTLVPPA